MLRKIILAAPVLVHYNTSRELLLACDASPYGVGAVFSQRMEDDNELPVAFASCSLSPTEKDYSQLDWKQLAVIFCVEWFHQSLSVTCLS